MTLIPLCFKDYYLGPLNFLTFYCHYCHNCGEWMYYLYIESSNLCSSELQPWVAKYMGFWDGMSILTGNCILCWEKPQLVLKIRFFEENGEAHKWLFVSTCETHLQQQKHNFITHLDKIQLFFSWLNGIGKWQEKNCCSMCFLCITGLSMIY